MIDVEPLIVSGLDRLVPLPSGERADWHDVLGRAGEIRRRRRLGVPHPGTWSRLQIVVAVIVVGLILAACATVTYVAIETASANQALLEKGGPVHRSGYNGPVKLLPGRVATDALGMKASFQVFDHWYGEQGPGWLHIGKYLATGGFEVDSAGGIEVNTLDSPLARTARKLETLPGILMHDVSPVRLGRHSGRRYSFYLNHSLLTFGRCCVFGRREHDVILLGVGHRTIVIEKMPDYGNHDDGREIEQVIQSFRVHP